MGGAPVPKREPRSSQPTRSAASTAGRGEESTARASVKRGWKAVAGILAAVGILWQGPGLVSGWESPIARPPASSVVGVSRHPFRPTRDDSVVVFAAHPDDESLGAGGLIHAAAAAGARVRVVILTNGDGYLKGLDVGFRTLLSTPDRFIQYGERRQQEAEAAAKRLGLSADRVTFLG